MAIAFYIPALEDEDENQRLLQQQQMVLQRQYLLQQQYDLQAQLGVLRQQLLELEQQSAALSTGQPGPSGTAGSSSATSSFTPTATVSTSTPSTPAAASGPATPPNPLSGLFQHRFYIIMMLLLDILFREVFDNGPACTRCTICQKLCHLLRKVD